MSPTRVVTALAASLVEPSCLAVRRVAPAAYPDNESLFLASADGPGIVDWVLLVSAFCSPVFCWFTRVLRPASLTAALSALRPSAGPGLVSPGSTRSLTLTAAPEASAESQPADTSASTSALAQLRPVFQDINSRAGQAFEATEANAFIDQLIAAEDNGAPRNVCLLYTSPSPRDS